ncbi:hypothetical protein PILCRDRAFT_67316 [Piloderma croceum F 1598]|uniref:Autophagy-related protein 17 n=1 Tax=Piloderma croceum (strain F 1598) TaxID=765440 RepID=A0A0C3FZ45_PILCF|nr:hypothetical protein PILCRDRAFT_67316 [Piloderma croceum F 1598]
MSSEQPHLVSLVLQSKKALQHGEQLCSRANSLSNASAQCAVDILALDAKVRWISDAVLDQLKLAASVAKSIEQKRAQLHKQVQQWDDIRTQRSDALDTILESLGTQVVPPDFHEASSDSSLFGSQHSDEELEPEVHDIRASPQFQHSPTLTVRGGLSLQREKEAKDRKKWKTLRDFVDERAIEDALDTIENDRNVLDDMLAATDSYPENLTNTISTIQRSLPTTTALPSINDILESQAKVSTHMANHLESLASHYDQMAGALRESEAGEVFSEEDLQDMNRDTNELPSIMAELEESIFSIESSHEQLLAGKNEIQQQLGTHPSTLDDLDELGEIMTEMLRRQETVELDAQEHINVLHRHLLPLEDLHHRYVSYQTSFNKLLIEIARRRQYREAADKIVHSMMATLQSMSEDERRIRDEFNTEHGAHLPADICLCIENPPTTWEIAPWHGEALEVLPDIDYDLLVEVSPSLLI